MSKKGLRPSRPGIAGIVVSIVLMVCGPVTGAGIIAYSINESASGLDTAPTSLSNGTPDQLPTTPTSLSNGTPDQLPPSGLSTLIITGIVIAAVVFLIGLVLLIAMLVRRYGWHEDTPHHTVMATPPVPPTSHIDPDATHGEPGIVRPQSPPQVWPPTYTNQPPEDWGHPRSPYGDAAAS